MYLRNNKDPRFKIGVLSSQRLLKHSVCIRVAKSEHWTPSSPLPWDLAFHLNSFSNYYSSLSLSPQSITLSSLIFTKKTALHVQTTKMEGERTAKNVQKGARFKIQRESEARMLIRLTPPERGKMRASVLKNDSKFILFLNCFKLRFNVRSVNNFNNTSLNLLEKKDRGNHLSLFQYLRRVV